MSSIPVRKGAHGKRRSAPTEGIPGLRSTTSPPDRSNRQTSKENKEPSRPLTLQNSKKELWAGNMKLKEEIKALEEKQREMDAVLSRTKIKMEHVVTESKQEETSLKETIRDLSQKYSNLQNKVDACEKKLLTSHIDPVTLKSLETDCLQHEEMEERRQVTKVQVTQLREKFTENNRYLAETITKLKAMDTELDEIISNTDSNL